jgi:hypothetical protein
MMGWSLALLFDISDLTPFDAEKYLVMWFASAGAIAVFFYFQELFGRNEWPVLFVLGGAVLYLWH